MNHSRESALYLASCQSPFWRKVFAAELGYLRRYLRADEEVLTVGFGSAIISGHRRAGNFSQHRTGQAALYILEGAKL